MTEICRNSDAISLKRFFEWMSEAISVIFKHCHHRYSMEYSAAKSFPVFSRATIRPFAKGNLQFLFRSSKGLVFSERFRSFIIFEQYRVYTRLLLFRHLKVPQQNCCWLFSKTRTFFPTTLNWVIISFWKEIRNPRECRRFLGRKKWKNCQISHTRDCYKLNNLSVSKIAKNDSTSLSAISKNPYTLSQFLPFMSNISF